MVRLLPERGTDGPEVESLLDLAFAPGRTALSSYRLREGVPMAAGLCRIARDDFDTLVGCIRYWPVRIGAAGHAALLLGPVAVHPIRQGEGLGAALMAESLDRARERAWTRVLLVGDEPYYRRFGFTRAQAAGMDFPPPTNPARFLAKALAPGAFDGVSGMVRRWDGADPARPDAPPPPAG